MPDRKTKKVQTKRSQEGGRSSPTTGSYFLSLELENVRCFSERQTLDLSDGNGRPARWTILLGENGAGKTTILQLLVALEGIPVPGSDRSANSHYQRNGRLIPIDCHAMKRDPEGPAELAVAQVAYGAHLTSDSGPLTVDRHLLRVETYTATAGYSDIKRLGPVCYAYGSARRITDTTLSNGPSSEAIESYFTDETRLRNAEGWLLLLDYSASKPSSIRGQQDQRLKMVKDVLVKILPDVSDIRFDPSSGIMPTPSVEFETPYGWVPLRQLSHGYRTMIAWVVDFASRMVERYPDSPDPLAEPAVVLVDEIDLHLHPKWQRELIGFLTDRFPNTQFIVTSHSPLIVQAAAGANLAVLKREGDHVVIENHPETIRGWRVDQVLTSDLFGLETARPPDEEKLLLRRKEILAKSRLTKADQKKLEEINDELGPIPAGESFDEAKKTMELIEKSLKLMEKYQGTKT